jgi:sterol desaturase/sphingolipid hydroxylase (fatty acid hydroxylase superfamily)
VELYGFDYLFDPNKRLFYGYLLSSMLIALIYLLYHQNQKRLILSSKLWLHASAKLDYTYFVVNILIKMVLIFPIVLSAKTITIFMYEQATYYFGLSPFHLSYTAVMIFYTLAIFIVSDFTRYWLHRFLHTIPFLWEFHKVHHSAKVLTPFTFYRVHPIENILFGFRYSLSIGVVTGIFFYCFGAVLDFYSVLGVNVFVFVFNLLGSNLRHSHIKITYFPFLEKLFISPYMHQIHHSSKHFDKNYGGYLAIWDHWFGSLELSKNVDKLRFGLRKEQMKEYTSIIKLLCVPFYNLGKRKKRAIQ